MLPKARIPAQRGTGIRRSDQAGLIDTPNTPPTVLPQVWPIEARDGERLLGTIAPQGARLAAYLHPGRRLGTYTSAASAKRMIIASAGCRILKTDAEKQRRRRLKRQRWRGS
jgi:hypothetical protein